MYDLCALVWMLCVAAWLFVAGVLLYNLKVCAWYGGNDMSVERASGDGECPLISAVLLN